MIADRVLKNGVKPYKNKQFFKFHRQFDIHIFIYMEGIQISLASQEVNMVVLKHSRLADVLANLNIIKLSYTCMNSI
jgi:hypothetical protein